MISAAPTSLYRETFPDIPTAPRTVGPHVRYLLTGYLEIATKQWPYFVLVFLGIPVGLATGALDHYSLPFLFVCFMVTAFVIWRRIIPVCHAVFAGWRKSCIYRLGYPIRGRTVGKVKRITNRQGKPCAGYRLAWTFELDGATYHGHIDHLDRTFLQRIYEGSMVTVLYDPAAPEVSTLWMNEERLVQEAARAGRDEAPKRVMTKSARRFLLGPSTTYLWTVNTLFVE